MPEPFFFCRSVPSEARVFKWGYFSKDHIVNLYIKIGKTRKKCSKYKVCKKCMLCKNDMLLQKRKNDILKLLNTDKAKFKQK